MKNQIYSTSDLGLISLLRYSGCVPTSIICQQGKVVFQFEQTKEVQHIVDAYERGKIIKVDVSRLFSMLKDTKGAILRRLHSA